MSKERSIQHGIPQHEYFGIFLPTDQPGGMDCSSVADGIGLSYGLNNPLTGNKSPATLVCRESIYTDSYLFDVLSLLLYGLSGRVILRKMIARNPDMCKEIVELWCFRKE